MKESINCFRGNTEYLSNFYMCDVEYEGVMYPTSENAFQAAKIFIEGDPVETNRQRVNAGFNKVKPSEAKRKGKREVTLRPNWDKIKDDIMYDILRNKFTQHPELKKQLIETYPMQLVEGNYWNDNYWGYCHCPKCKSKVHHNKLGKLLMKLRDELIEQKDI